MTPGPGIEPGTHWWKASALTTTPTLLPMEKRYPFGFILNYWRPIYRLKHCLYINIMAKFLYIVPVEYQMGK